MSKTFRAEQTREKRRRPQSKKSKRGSKKHQTKDFYVEPEETYQLKE